MNKTTIFQRLLKIENEVAQLNNTIFALKTIDIEKYGTNYEELSTNAALRAERIACQLRNLIQITDFKWEFAYMRQAANTLGIRISYEDRILSVVLPGLLPKRKLHTNTAFLRDPLHYALKEFLKGHKIEPYKECVICFCLVYDQALPQRRIKDYDNLELKLILDVISTYVLFDDNGLYCDNYHTTELGNCDQTIIYIMEKNRFEGWFENREKAKNTLSENMCFLEILCRHRYFTGNPAHFPLFCFRKNPQYTEADVSKVKIIAKKIELRWYLFAETRYTEIQIIRDDWNKRQVPVRSITQII